MSEDRIPTTRAGYDKKRAELDHLQGFDMIEITKRVASARDMGDLSENGDYHAAKDEQGHMEGRIRHLEHLLHPLNHEIFEVGDAELIGPGSIVTIVYDGDDDDMAERYLIGHPEEKTADLDVMSPQSPLGMALLDKGPGDWVEYDAPHGKLKVKVLEVESA